MQNPLVIPVGTQVRYTCPGRGNWTGVVVAHTGTHEDQLRVRRDNGSVSDWPNDYGTPVK